MSVIKLDWHEKRGFVKSQCTVTHDPHGGSPGADFYVTNLDHDKAYNEIVVQANDDRLATYAFPRGSPQAYFFTALCPGKTMKVIRWAPGFVLISLYFIPDL